MTPDHEVFADWDAAYVLGALPPAERRDFERHLDDCARCRSAVAELAALPGLLAAARPVAEPVDGPGLAPPADLLERMAGRAERRRTRRLRILLGALAAAAAVVIAVAVPLLVQRPAPPAATLVLEQVVDTAMTATVELTPVAWGTRIGMECDYPGGGWAGAGGSWSYVLVVVDDDGESSEVSTWNAVAGERIRLDAATAVPFDEIAAIEVRSPGGEAILAASVGD